MAMRFGAAMGGASLAALPGQVKAR
jgi:hypothetical protein